MKNSATINRAKATVTTTTASAELNKIGATVITFSAAAIGCWSMVALFAGTISSGGPLGLLNALSTTITG